MNRPFSILSVLIFFALGSTSSGWASSEEIGTSAEERDYHELAPGIRFDGNLRLRGEVRDFTFDKTIPGHDDEFLLSRIRLNLNVEPKDWLKMFVEVQDSRIFLNDQIDETAVPSIFEDALDLHQLFVDFKYSPNDTVFKLRIGRQKLVYGQQRLVGAFEWANTARVFDALKLSIGKEGEAWLDLFASRVVSVDPNSPNDWSSTGKRYADSDFHGAYYTNRKLIQDTQFEAYWLLRHEDTAGDEVHTLGTRFGWKHGVLDADAEFMGQVGDFGEGIDQEAFALHIGGGYTVERWNRARLGISYNFATGDDNPDDNKHKTFDNLFPTNHLHYGYMDLMSFRNMHNLEFSAQTTWRKVGVRLAYHWLWLAEEDTDAWYNAGGRQIRNAAGTGLNPDPFLGQEVDLKVTCGLWNGRVKLEGGYSHFFNGKYLEDFGLRKDADFAYLMTVLKF